MTREELTARLRAALQGRADVPLALLFGSFARDRATDQSDADVAILRRGLDLPALSDALSLAAGIDVDVAEPRAATIPLLDAIVRDGVVLHEATRGAEASWRSATLAMLETDGPLYRRTCDAWRRARGAGRPWLTQG